MTKTYPILLKFGLRVERLARHYHAAQGDPNLVRSGNISAEEETAILALYKAPPQGMSYIEELRNSLAGEICPMCGGSNPTTLDHYLMKQKYPEYALLTYNLVPACSCNQKRGERLYDAATQARILHPYYDDFMSNPLIKLNFNPGIDVPIFQIVYLMPVADPNFRNLEYHVQNVILRTNFLTFIGKRWTKVKFAPDGVLPGHFRHRSTQDEFHHYLLEQSAARSADEGCNSWASIFFRSISEREVSDWLFENYEVLGH
ncbi:hypothetical protein [Sulfitobacter sp. HGT1]|uniref:hypothetical protein n=1 Tax=Sulfitobacter sp. HGT1 TaxID=2735435 RepID=UPI001593487D|nr:hypothetical protein [Sulfitobacter sp. HGT1]